MSENTETEPKLTLAERYQANLQLEELLKKGGVKTRTWQTEQRGALEPGTGVNIYNGEGDQIATMTVAGTGKLVVRNVLESIDLTDPTLKAIVSAIPEKFGISLGKFIPDTEGDGKNGPKPKKSYGPATFFRKGA